MLRLPHCCVGLYDKYIKHLKKRKITQSFDYLFFLLVLTYRVLLLYRHTSHLKTQVAHILWHHVRVGIARQFITGQHKTVPTTTLQPLVSRICMSLDCNMKLERLEKTYTGTGRTCTYKAWPHGSKLIPVFLVWVNNTNHCTMLPNATDSISETNVFWMLVILKLKYCKIENSLSFFKYCLRVPNIEK